MSDTMAPHALTPHRGGGLRTVEHAARKTLFAIRKHFARSHRLPDFIVIGAQRAGTTSLFNLLSAHPDVTPAVVKEVHYFDLNYNKGTRWYRSHFPVTSWIGYSRRHIWGEASPYYLFLPEVSERVRETVPEVRLIALLRNPIDRAYSDFQRQVWLGHERLSFEEAIAAERQRTNEAQAGNSVRRHSYIARGCYTEQLERWLKHFPAEQMLILPAERFFREMAATMKQVFAFLELPEVKWKHPRADNALSYPPMNPETRQVLRTLFAENRRRLEHLTGLRFDWDI